MMHEPGGLWKECGRSAELMRRATENLTVDDWSPLDDLMPFEEWSALDRDVLLKGTLLVVVRRRGPRGTFPGSISSETPRRDKGRGGAVARVGLVP
jgi:hypothetical protein